MASRIISRLYHFAKGSTPLKDLPAAWQPGVDAALKEIEKAVGMLGVLALFWISLSPQDPRFVQAEIK